MKAIKEILKKITGDPKNPQAFISALYQHCFCNPDPVKQLDWQAALMEYNKIEDGGADETNPEYILILLRMEELSRKYTPNEKETLNEYKMKVKEITNKYPDGPPEGSDDFYMLRAYKLGVKRMNEICRSVDKNVY